MLLTHPHLISGDFDFAFTLFALLFITGVALILASIHFRKD